VLAAAALAWFAADVLVRRVQAARLPEPPAAGVVAPAVAAMIADADRAARRQPTSADAIGELALAYHASDLAEIADRVYAIAESLSPDWRWTYYRGLLHEEHGRQPEALAAYTRVTAADPSNGLAWFHIAEIAFKEGRLDAAEQAYTRAQDAPAVAPFSVSGVTHQGVPLTAYAALGLARIAIERGQSDQARARLEPIVKAQPRFGPARALLGQIQGTDSGPKASPAPARGLRAYVPPADPWLDAVVARSRQSDLLLKHAALAARGGDRPWLEFLVRRALESNPEALDVLLEMAATLQAAGRHDQALEYLKRCEQVAPDDHHVLVEEGKTLADLGRLDEAAGYAEAAYRKAEAAKDRTSTEQALIQRARVYRGQGNLTRAEEMLATVEPMLRHDLPTGHYAFASVGFEHALIAYARRDLASALRQVTEALAITEAAVKAGGQGGHLLPFLLISAATFELEAGKPQAAVVHAQRAVALLGNAAQQGSFSTRVGRADAILGRALRAVGKDAEARAALQLAAEQLAGSLGPNNPESVEARRLASVASP